MHTMDAWVFCKISNRSEPIEDSAGYPSDSQYPTIIMSGSPIGVCFGRHGTGDSQVVHVSILDAAKDLGKQTTV